MKKIWNNTKIIATVGPACRSPNIMRGLIYAGMDIARFNFSHGTAADQIADMRRIRAMAARCKRPLGIMQDLPGPKIRIGPLTSEFIDLKKGQFFALTSGSAPGNEHRVALPHRTFLAALRPNHVVYLNDGLVRLLVRRVERGEVSCEVVAGGRVFPRKGVSCPQLKLSLSGVTAADLQCLAAGIQADIDYVAISFVQDSRDVRKVKRFLRQRNSRAMVIAKIERKVALNDLQQIVRDSDALMVARGDLGVEAELEQIPLLQKEIIRLANEHGKPVITATQMLESMVRNPQPTRAEVTDIANAILDGTDAIMLSEETAVGAYPVACVQTMVRIAQATEKHFPRHARAVQLFTRVPWQRGMMVSAAAADIAERMNARIIAAPTNHAASLAWLSALRPGALILGLTSDRRVAQQLLLYGGVFPLYVPRLTSVPHARRQCAHTVTRFRLGRAGEPLVVMLTRDNRLFSSDLIELTTV